MTGVGFKPLERFIAMSSASGPTGFDFSTIQPDVFNSDGTTTIPTLDDVVKLGNSWLGFPPDGTLGNLPSLPQSAIDDFTAAQEFLFDNGASYGVDPEFLKMEAMQFGDGVTINGQTVFDYGTALWTALGFELPPGV